MANITGHQSIRKTRLKAAFVAALFLSASPSALRADTSNAELAKEIAELKAQIHAMRGAIAETRTETRRTTAKVRAVAEHGPAPTTITSNLPDGATPVFVTASKQMQFGALTITPGGFVDMYGIYRNKNLSADTNSPLGNIPTNNSNNAHIGEARLSARNTRVALLIESPISANMIVAGYGELDFRAAGTTSSPGQTNNFVPRIRQLYSTLDNNELGLHFLAGQAWSLITANSKGITPRNEVLPPTLDNVVLPGYDYSRTPQIRLVKDFNKKLWLGLSVENPQTAGLNGSGACGNTVSNTGAAAPGVIAANTAISGGTCVTAAGASTDFGGTGTAQNITLNRIPNVIGKVAYEARFADRDVHLEALGLFKEAATYVNYGAAAGSPSSAQYTKMGGVGANIVIPVLPGKLDFQAGGEYGTGFGYYTSSGLQDATVGPDGKVKALRGESGYAGFIAHVTPAIDLYTYAGIDQVQRNFTQVGATQVGYGATTANNTGCNLVGGVCAGATHRIWQLTGGFTDKLYKGSFGEVRVAAQYSFTERELFSGNGFVNAAGTATSGGPQIGARAVEHIVMTSLRYYPFQ